MNFFILNFLLYIQLFTVSVAAVNKFIECKQLDNLFCKFLNLSKKLKSFNIKCSCSSSESICWLGISPLKCYNLKFYLSYILLLKFQNQIPKCRNTSLSDVKIENCLSNRDLNKNHVHRLLLQAFNIFFEGGLKKDELSCFFKASLIFFNKLTQFCGFGKSK